MSKYNSFLKYLGAKAYRTLLRRRVAALVSWKPRAAREPGCTAVIAMCSRLPQVLKANLACLNTSRWPELKQVIVAVDGTETALAPGFAAEIIAAFPALNIRFVYYNATQAAVTDREKIGYLYSWLSWCNALNHVRTRTALIHDYDALVLGPSLQRRHAAYEASGVRMQGVSWYQVNGFVPEDRLATTFEAFVDVDWLQSKPPVTLFNRVATWRGRRVDYDTMLEIQALFTPEEKRSIMPMELNELVHPTQMLCQYTAFRKYPGRVLPCFSITMLPLFLHLGGDADIYSRAADAIVHGTPGSIDLIGDGTAFNLSLLDTAAVDFVLKLTVQALVRRGEEPIPSVIAYGRALYSVTSTPPARYWVGDFTAEQRAWIDAAVAREACEEVMQ